MNRTVNPSGTGLQLWEVSRLYVELHSAWPSSMASEVWTSHVVDYTLPRSRLGLCLDGSLTIVTPPGDLPVGFELLSDYPGRPVRCTLAPYTRLALVVAVLPNGDEVVIYSGVLGQVQAQGDIPDLWTVPLIAPGSIRSQEFVMPGGTGPVAAMPSPAGLPPFQGGQGRFYIPTGKTSSTDPYYSNKIPAGAVTPATTIEDWWKLALQDDPLAEFGAGPDVVWTAGSPLGTTPTRATYALDWRAAGLSSAGRETPPYLTRLRGVVASNVEERSRANLPAFLPTRTATYGGNETVEPANTVVPFAVTGEGWITAALGYPAIVTSNAVVPSYTGVLKQAAMTTVAEITNVQGRVKITFEAWVVSSVTANPQLINEPMLAVDGTFRRTVSVEPSSVMHLQQIQTRWSVEALEAGAGADVHVYVETASGLTEEMGHRLTWEAQPPGIEYPYVTDEAWMFSLPGVHAGPLLVTGLPNGEQYASTVIRTSMGTNGRAPELWTDVRTGPLPYRRGPTDSQGRWRD